MISIKDLKKFVGIIIIMFCAVFICNLFLNYRLDLKKIEVYATTNELYDFYKARVATANMVSFVTGACLFLTSITMLFFYIKNYLDVHKNELGILKALGYRNMQISRKFWIFGLSVLLGGTLGYLASFLVIPLFYNIQNKSILLPPVSLTWHLILYVYLVIFPTLAFSLLSIFYTQRKLKSSALSLIKEVPEYTKLVKKTQENESDTFMKDLQKTTLKSKKTLVFFIGFSAFCFSEMIQMSASIKEFSDILMAIITIGIGVVLATTIVILAIESVIKGNLKTIAVMNTFGYSKAECSKSVLDGYKIFAYLGFMLGTLYQYGILSIMVNVVFSKVDSGIVYNFDFKAFIVTFVLFVFTYEILMAFYKYKISKISIKEIMLQ
ncbi:ABC transporter, permease [Alteracholeplasma palmae J233]|uniref:ABC transporter, permease n=1 Tax=Alteracholeplasma palmae (strain ATCC 49389 / J233) TaxID=1318466 RepID=U4KS58_ALTPJ|nr:FtsX-like permease family protein [Alteracholeplasma palmae]CCV64746.1 ABC transporter, permease [Alteracholeplasma palmae J233]